MKLMDQINFRKKIKNIEKDCLEQYLKFTKGNKVKAAALLGMKRPTLIARLKSLGMIEWMRKKTKDLQ